MYLPPHDHEPCILYIPLCHLHLRDGIVDALLT